MIFLFLVGMPLRVRFKRLFSLHCDIDFFLWDDSLFQESMRYYCRQVSVKKIEYAVVLPLKAHSQFVNPVAEKVCFRSPQLTTQLGKSLQARETLSGGSLWDRVKPVDNRDRSVVFFEEDNFCLGHRLTSNVRIIANTGQGILVAGSAILTYASPKKGLVTIFSL